MSILDAIRDVKRRLERAEEQSARELPSVKKPERVPTHFGDPAKLR
jgi:hypothetical protein